ncbi:hypothetical protein [Xanthomonas sp. 3058]|uniref:hypothetical protein n=1 Tax=Xanthomonas sp. 3058 TaxID=3035314 RepID=UPI00160F8175|nr:hypothetical protein [Xanthomonas sp. 3058]MBB5864299.1 hypothetical protein [Xanthomonas sp. 3058]
MDRQFQTLKERIGFFLAVLFTIAYKSNDALSNPQFWAEDATVFFKDQFGNVLPQLFTPYAGYLHATPRAVAWITSWLPSAKAPLIYNASAIILSTVALTLTCKRLQRYIPAWIVALAFLAVPTSGEIFGTITNTQWFLQFALAAYCLAPAEQSGTLRTSLLRALGILTIALTGPFSILLLIVIVGMFAASLAAKRSTIDPFDGALSDFLSTRDWYIFSALALGAVLQAAVLLTSPPAESGIQHDVLPTLKITFTELVPIHIFGSDFLTGTAWLLLYALLIGTLLLSRKIDGRARLIVMGFIAFAAIEVFAPVVRMKDFSPLYGLAAADRYFYLAKVIWWWAVWLALSGASRRSRWNATVMTSALICLFALTNQQYLRRTAFVDYAWRGHAKQLDLPGPHTVPVNPPGWGITVETPTTKEVK